MEIEDHHKEFMNIIAKYALNSDEKAEEISLFLTNADKKAVSAEEFANLFEMELEEAITFLSFIQKGIEFKKNSCKD